MKFCISTISKFNEGFLGWKTGNSIRTSASGGFFGFLGKFRNESLGNYQMYVTNKSQSVLVKYDGQTIVFSCEKHEELIDFVKKRVGKKTINFIIFAQKLNNNFLFNSKIAHIMLF